MGEILLVILLVVFTLGIALMIGEATQGHGRSERVTMDNARLKRDNERLRQDVAWRVEHNELLAQAYLEGAIKAMDKLDERVVAAASKQTDAHTDYNALFESVDFTLLEDEVDDIVM